MKTLLERLYERVEFTDECWNWTGSKHRDGYGQFSYRRNGIATGGQAHRLIYKELNGELPKGLQLDHLCRNRLCVNPKHLELVTPRENTLRGNTIAARNVAKRYCKRGHRLFGKNLYVCPRGRRECKTCRNINVKRFLKKDIG